MTSIKDNSKWLDEITVLTCPILCRQLTTDCLMQFIPFTHVMTFFYINCTNLSEILFRLTLKSFTLLIKKHLFQQVVFPWLTESSVLSWMNCCKFFKVTTNCLSSYCLVHTTSSQCQPMINSYLSWNFVSLFSYREKSPITKINHILSSWLDWILQLAVLLYVP